MKIRVLKALLFHLVLAVSLSPIAISIAEPSNQSWRWQAARVVVVPDIHGAYTELTQLLKASEIIDASLSWIGGEAHLVSLGDLVDRGPNSRAVMDLLMRLQHEATAAGGRVHVILGNHEHMNLIGDLRYVSRAEYATFVDVEVPEVRTQALAQFTKDHPDISVEQLNRSFDERYPPGYFGHRASFRPEGRYGAWLLSLPVMVIVNDTVYVHGGLPQSAEQLSPGQLNQKFSADLHRYVTVWRQLVTAGVLSDDEAANAVVADSPGTLAQSSTCVEKRALSCPKPDNNEELAALVDEFGRLSASTVNQNDSPFWYRGTVYCRSILVQTQLDTYLESLGVGRAIVGHTPTADRRVHVIQGGRVVMADTGMLSSYYRGRPAALVLEDGEMQVQYLNPDERTAPIIDGRVVAHGLNRTQLEVALAQGDVRTAEALVEDKISPIKLEYKNQPIKALFYPNALGKAAEHELAAYALDGLLGMELIPPTVARKIGALDGALQLSYPDSLSEQQRRERKLAASGWCSIAEQFQLMYAFDIVTDNKARNAETIFYRTHRWQLYLIDHRSAFGKSKRLPAGLSKDLIDMPAGVANALATLDQQALQRELGLWLDEKQIRALLARRDALLEFAAQH